jgi:UDP-N-acetylmuramoyl-tripeptide--D-alanyl-D-alanine ligase
MPYFALSGERFNGNEFAIEALEKGASYAIVDNPSLKEVAGCIYVKNALKTLQAWNVSQELLQGYRDFFNRK